jgi:hypothetical protein
VQVVVDFGCVSRREVVEVRQVAMGLVIGHLSFVAGSDAVGQVGSRRVHLCVARSLGLPRMRERVRMADVFAPNTH